MSTSFLYHSSKIQGIRYVSTSYEENRIVFKVEPNAKLFVCASCKSTKVIRNGGSERLIRNLHFGRKITYIRIFQPRLRCRSCGMSHMMRLPFVEKWKSYTRAVALEVLDLAKAMTIQDVADHLGLSWRTVRDIQKDHLRKRFRRPDLKKIRRIGIDEICIGKGPRFMTVVVDLDSGRVVFMAEGKGSDSLLPFWQRLKRARVTIEAVAIDMGPAYIAAVTEHLPKATIVFDHFHVIKLFNEKLSDFRRDLHHHLPEDEQKRFLKGSRWLFLKNAENLDESKNEKARLEKALSVNAPLATVYYMKEELRQIWKQDSRHEAEVLLQSWAAKAEVSGIPMLKKFGHLLLSRRNGILAYYDDRLSSGPVEGINNKIKVILRMGYGYRDDEFFRLKVYASHEAKCRWVI